MSRVEEVVERLGGGKRSGSYWMVPCPGHEDRVASLAVAEGRDGCVVMKCHAGCTNEHICAVAGLDMAMLFPPRTETARRVEEAEYLYPDENDRVLFGVVRYHPKEFRQFVPLDNGERQWRLNGVRRVPFQLPKVLKGIDDGRHIVIVEGEKDVLRLRALNIVATCNAGGAGKWRPEWSPMFAGAKVCIIPDNDTPGRDHARQVATMLHGTAAFVRVVELPGLGPGGDISDWLDRGLGTPDELKELLANAPEWEPGLEPEPEPAASDWEKPVDLTAARSLPEFPTRALPRELRDFVEWVAHSTQTPEDFAGVQVLGVLATACAKRAVVRVKPDWDEPLNLFAMVAAPPGSRKSNCMSQVTAPLYEIERDELARRKPDIVEARVRKEIALGRAKSAEQAATKATDDRDPKAQEAIELAKEAEEIVVPPEPRFVVDDVTPEALAQHLASHGRIAVFSAEAGTITDIMAGRYSPKGMPPLDVFLKGHAGDDLRVDRRARPAEIVHQPALTMVLMAQPIVFRSIARQPGFDGRGLLARNLYSMPASNIGRRAIETESVPESVREAYATRVRNLISTLAERTEPAVLALTEMASAREVEYRKALEPRLGEGGDLHHLQAWAGKLAGAVVRIAGLLHLAKNDDTGDLKPIDVDTYETAVEIGDYFLQHAKAVFEYMGADPAVEKARTILVWARDKLDEPAFTKRDCHRALQAHFKAAHELDAPLALLEDHGWLRCTRFEPSQAGGRSPSPRYDVHPDIYVTQLTELTEP